MCLSVSNAVLLRRLAGKEGWAIIACSLGRERVGLDETTRAELCLRVFETAEVGVHAGIARYPGGTLVLALSELAVQPCASFNLELLKFTLEACSGRYMSKIMHEVEF
jgi:hypothetical protein